MRKHLAAVLLALPAPCLAGGYAVINVNPRDLGMAGSAVAAQVDAGAVFANPAALAGLASGLHLSLGASSIDFRSDWKDPSTTASGSMVFHPAWPPAVYAAWAGRLGERGWGLGAGLTVPFGGNVYWPRDWPGRFQILTVNRRVYGTYLTGGVEALPWLKLGGGFIYYRTTEYLKQGVNFITSESFAELGTAGGAPSFQASAEVMPLGADVPVKLGLDYKHQAVQKLTGKAHFENPPAALAPTALDQDVTHFLTVPNYLGVGASWQPTEAGLVTASFTWDRFRVYRSDVFAGSAGTTITVPRDYRNGYTLRLGGEIHASRALTLRLGLLRDFAPTRTDRLSPTIPDADTWGFSVGAAYAVTPRLAVQGAWFFAAMDQIHTTGTVAFPGVYDTSASILSVGIVWRPAAE
jgi:long-chain fatty acid transport protein